MTNRASIPKLVLGSLLPCVICSAFAIAGAALAVAIVGNLVVISLSPYMMQAAVISGACGWLLGGLFTVAAAVTDTRRPAESAG